MGAHEALPYFTKATVRRPAVVVEEMVRGHAKADAQQKNAKKLADMKKNGSQLGMADKAMVYCCPTCKQQCPNVKLYKQHFDSKHPTECFPTQAQADLDAVEAKKAGAATAAADAEALQLLRADLK